MLRLDRLWRQRVLGLGCALYQDAGPQCRWRVSVPDVYVEVSGVRYPPPWARRPKRRLCTPRQDLRSWVDMRGHQESDSGPALAIFHHRSLHLGRPGRV